MVRTTVEFAVRILVVLSMLFTSSPVPLALAAGQALYPDAQGGDPTSTPTATATATDTVEPTATATGVISPTATATLTPTMTSIVTVTPTVTIPLPETVSATATNTAEVTATATPMEIPVLITPTAKTVPLTTPLVLTPTVSPVETLLPELHDTSEKTEALIYVPIILKNSSQVTKSQLTEPLIVQGLSESSITTSAFPGQEVLVGEVGQLGDTLTHQAQTVLLSRAYADPVVFAQPLSFDGSNQSVVRITDVQSDRFTLYVDEAPNLDGSHTTETVSYMVVEAGAWELLDGRWLEVGKLNTAATVNCSSQWASVSFGSDFGSVPVVLSQVQTENDAHFVSTRQRAITALGFEVALEEDEVQTACHGSETIGWLAIEGGQGDWSGHTYEAGTTTAAVTHDWYQISFGQAPRFLATLASYNGGDSAHLRYDQATLSTGGVQVLVEEDTTQDTETNHTTEAVSYLALEGDGVLAVYTVADFVGTPLGGTSPLMVVFTNMSRNADSYVWDFGDGGTSTAENPTHTYTDPGTYTVSLTVTGYGGTDTETRFGYINVADDSITGLSVTNNGPTMLGQSTTLTATVSAGTNVSYVWDLGDGETGTGTVISHTYLAAGDYTAVVTASNSVSTMTATTIVNITGTPVLTISKSAPALVQTGQPITYTLTVTNSGNVTATNLVITDVIPADAAYVSGGDTISNNIVGWTIPALATSDRASVQFVVTAMETITNSDYAVTADGPVSAKSQEEVTTIVYEPVVADFSAFPRRETTPALVQFFDNSTGEIDTHLWDFGDPSSGSGQAITSTLPSPTHTYTMPGVYMVSLTVSGPYGSDTLTKTNYITVTPVVIADFFANPLTGTTPLTVTFVNSSVNATDYEWNFGDGTTTSQINPTHVYTQVGVYSVSLRADGSGSSDALTRSNYITVTPPLLTDLSVSKTAPLTAAAGMPITYTLTVTNSGSVTATNLVITDAVPLGAHYVLGSGGMLSSNNVVSWTVDSLAPNDSVDVHFAVTATEAITNNDYAVLADDGIRSVGQEAVTTLITDTGTPELTISKTGPVSAVFGEPFTYTLSVTNTGDGVANSLVITDIIPDGAHYVNGGSRIGDTVHWAVPTLDPGSSVTANFVVTATTATITNSNYGARAGGHYQVLAKLLADDGTASDWFGNSVAISGNTAIVGAQRDDNYSGSAYIFAWEDTSWVQQAKLTADDGAANDYFGWSVAISGNTVIVGAVGDDDNGTSSGSAYIFVWDGTSWVQQAKLTPDDGAVSDYFGDSVALSGNTAIVGAWQDDDHGSSSGSAYTFVWDGTDWVQQAKLTADDGAASDCFGSSVAISGITAIVGAYGDDDHGSSSGSAYIFSVAPETETFALSQNVVTTSVTMPPITATFSAAPLTGTVPLTVSFVATTTGASMLLWDFGDGITQTITSSLILLSSPITTTHTYTQSGIFTVSLNATGPGGSVTQTGYITVTDRNYIACCAGNAPS